MPAHIHEVSMRPMRPSRAVGAAWLALMVLCASAFAPGDHMLARAQEPAAGQAAQPDFYGDLKPSAEQEKAREEATKRRLQQQREAAAAAKAQPPAAQAAPKAATGKAAVTQSTQPPAQTPPPASVSAPPTPTPPVSSGAPSAPATPTPPVSSGVPSVSAPSNAPAPATSTQSTTTTTTTVAPAAAPVQTIVVPVPAPATTIVAPAVRTTEQVVVEQGTEAPLAPGDASSNDEPPAQPVIERGSGQFFNMQSAQRIPAGPVAGDVTFNWENASIQEVVKAILGDLMQENYVIAPNVQGTVTFATAKPINANQSLSVLEMVLAWNSATLVYKDGRYTVLPLAQALPGNLTPRFGPTGDARGYEVRIVPLRYVSATEMEKLLQPYARPGAVVRADNARHFLVLAGNKAELQNYLETIETFDVNWLTGMSVGIYPLERVEAKVVVPELEKVFGDGAGTPLAGMFRFMAIDRLNAVLVITPQPTYLEEAQKWLTRLDRGGSESGAQIYVYYVKNVKAKDLAANLSDIFGGRSSGAAPSAPVGAVVPGIESVEVKTTDSANAPKRESQARYQQPKNEGITAVSNSDIRITAIEESNALLIKATPGEYDAILRAIKRLDEVPLQVHIETRILLVDLTDNLSLGVEWFFENSTSGAGALAYRTNSRGYNAPPGNTFNHRDAWNSFAGTVGAAGVKWTFLSEAAEALISSLQTNGNARVLSAPSLVVLNNKKASINVGKQIPVTSTYFNGGTVGVPTDPNNPGNTTNYNTSYVQFRDTGIILDVTPRVNPGGLVFMEIKQEQSTPGDASTAINGNVPVDKRVIDTEIAVQSGQTVLLGGLISDTEQQSKAGVPGLSRIPVIGGLFGTQSRNHQRQELLVLLTPTVIENSVQAQDLSDEYKSRFRGLKPLFLQSELDKQ